LFYSMTKKELKVEGYGGKDVIPAYFRRKVQGEGGIGQGGEDEKESLGVGAGVTLREAIKRG